MATPTPLQDELIALEKSLAGFHKDHYIRQSLIEQIAILRPKAATEKSNIAYNLKFTLEEQLAEQEKSLAGFWSGHYIVPTIEAEIKQLEEKIIQKKTRN